MDCAGDSLSWENILNHPHVYKYKKHEAKDKL